MISRSKSTNDMTMQNLRCPNDGKKLGAVRPDYFDIPDKKNGNQNQGKVFIKCPKCKKIIAF